MAAALHHPAHEAAVARVRAALEAAGVERVALLAAHSKRLLEARAGGETLRAIGDREKRTGQTIAWRQRRALEALTRDPLAGLR